MRIVSIGGRRYAQFERLSREPGLAHAFSTRPDDVSARTDDRMAERAARRTAMARDLGFSPQRLSYCVQVHQPGLARVAEPADFGRRENLDGLYTTVADAPLMTFSADCPLVLAYDPAARALGMAHSSWRCTAANMTTRLIEAMRRELDARPERMLAGIGPSAGPNQYEVKDDVYDAMSDQPNRERLFFRRDGRMFFDLWEANRAQFVAAGVPADSIEIAGICTMTDSELFYSFRREQAGCGHFGLMAGLRTGS